MRVIASETLTATRGRVMISDMSTQTQSRRPVDSLANRVLLVRQDMLGRISQREAAIRCGITYRTWQGLELGTKTQNRDEVLTKIAQVAHVDRDWLMDGGSLDPVAPPTSSTNALSRCSAQSLNVTPLLRKVTARREYARAS